MNCANHADVQATAYCRTCGKALCANCTRDVRGVIYCEDCIAARVSDAGTAAQQPFVAQAIPVAVPGKPRGMASPGLAALLGFIPGVGAVYNGQYGKGLIHLIAFVCLIAAADRVGPITIPVFFFLILYMVIDAYRTAHARELGLPLPDPLGLNNVFGNAQPAAAYAGPAGGAPVNAAVAPVEAGYVAPEWEEPQQTGRGAPVGAIILIVLGALFFFGNLGLIGFDWFHKLWPLLLIALGIHLFIRRRRSVAR
jgi:hypothetical protein